MRLVIRFGSPTACWPRGRSRMLHQMSRRNPSDRILELGEPVKHEPDLSGRPTMLRPAKSAQGSSARLS